MSVVSLLTRFCLFRAPRMCLAEKMSRNPTNSLFSFLCCTRQLINAVIYHVFTFLQNRSQNYFFSWDSLNFECFFHLNQWLSCFYMPLWLVLQESNPCFNRNLIFFLFDFCLYTSLWYKRGKSNLFSIIAMQINAPSTPQIPSEGWYSPHQLHPQRVEQSPRHGILLCRNLSVWRGMWACCAPWRNGWTHLLRDIYLIDNWLFVNIIDIL